MGSGMEISVGMPLDDDGYIDRECPVCERRFRWRYGVSAELVETSAQLTEYYCPYCGTAAEADQWWTPEQVEYIHASAIAALRPELEEKFRDATASIGRTGLVDVRFETASPEPPRPVFVEDDETATTVASPCHPDEPVKLFGDWSPPIHCSVCGARYVV